MPTINILGEPIEISEIDIEISKLRYNESNPRIYTILEEQQVQKEGPELQELIYDVMLGQSSVTSIYKSIQDGGGLVEPIVVRYDTFSVVEGNSRLTVYKSLNKRNRQDERWQKITCRIVDTLTDEQEDSFLNILHGQGKTPWQAYENAKLIYKRFTEGVSLSDIKKRFSPMTNKSILDEIWIIDTMKENGDDKRSNYSYYSVIRKTRGIRSELIENPTNKKNQDILKIVLEKIKQPINPDENSDENFTAQGLRAKLPSILASNFHKKKYIDTKDLDAVHNSAKTSDPVKKIKKVTSVLSDVTKTDINNLKQSELSRLKIACRRMKREAKRIYGLYENARNNQAD